MAANKKDIMYSLLYFASTTGIWGLIHLCDILTLYQREKLIVDFPFGYLYSAFLINILIGLVLFLAISFGRKANCHLMLAFNLVYLIYMIRTTFFSHTYRTIFMTHLYESGMIAGILFAVMISAIIRLRRDRKQ